MSARACLGCGEIVTKFVRGRCVRCVAAARAYDNARRPARNAPYGGAVWREVRAEHLEGEPNCRSCGRLATEVDHIIPLSQGGSAHDHANLQSLCKPCHSRKTMRELRASRRWTGFAR